LRPSSRRSRLAQVAVVVVLTLLGAFITANEVGIAENLTRRFPAWAVIVVCLVIFAGILWSAAQLDKDDKD
jgi:protein-S-isoprenylcysteine O-methyltransferase Ste14